MSSARLLRSMRTVKLALSLSQRSYRQSNVLNHLQHRNYNQFHPRLLVKDHKGLNRIPIDSKHHHTHSNSKKMPFTCLAVLGFIALIKAEESKHSITRGADTEIIDENANLLEYPTEREFAFDQNCQLTIGDLHGNALKLIYFLVRQNVLDLSRENYNAIVHIYQKNPDELTKDDITKFNAILENAQFHKIPNGAMIRLIGDELADRGNNDYFVLKIFEKMAMNNVPFEVLFSNHGFEFIKVYEKGLLDTKSYLEKHEGGFAQSLTNLRDLVKRQIIPLEEVDVLVKQYYLPHLKLISYSLQPIPSNYSFLLTGLANEFELQDPIIPGESITIYSHAPIGVETIKSLTQREGIQVPYSEETTTDLANSIDQINMKFSDIANTQHVLATFGTELGQKVKVDDISLNFPVLRTIWSRGHQDKDVPLTMLNRYSLYYAHGHDGNGKVNDTYKDHVTNLDNSFGKGKDHECGKYSILQTHSRQLR